jgi:hypothetical protein
MTVITLAQTLEIERAGVVPAVRFSHADGLAGPAKIPTSYASVLKEDASMSHPMLRISIALTMFLMAEGVALASKIIGNG